MYRRAEQAAGKLLSREVSPAEAGSHIRKKRRRHWPEGQLYPTFDFFNSLFSRRGKDFLSA